MKRIAFCVALALVSCRSTEMSVQGPYASQASEARHTARAEQLTKDAAELAASDPVQAEKLLREALSADLFFGPAHNNLGVLFLRREQLYEAAHEFEWARKLMPGHPDPRFNLAMTLEQAGQIDEALASYTAALEVYSEYLPAIKGLASLTLRTGREDERLKGWLGTIAMRSEAPAWREWAKSSLTRHK